LIFIAFCFLQFCPFTKFRTFARNPHFPNPAHELLHIVGLENEQEVSILGFSGNVLQQNVRSSQIDVRNLPIGMYWLHVQTTGNYIVLPFVKL